MPACGRAAIVRRWFGLDRRHHRPPPLLDAAGLKPQRLLPDEGQLLLITGPSGSGKSTLLSRLRRLGGGRCIDLDDVVLPHRPVIELFNGRPLEDDLALLARLGLAEAHTWLLPPGKLSAGQRWRLRLALALQSARSVRGAACIVSDEFAGTLDSITGIIVARALRRMIDGRSRLRAIVATARDDLRRALRPDMLVECDFGHVQIKRAQRGA